MLDQLFPIHSHAVRGVPQNIRRYLYNQIRWSSKTLCLSGARGVGKTTLLIQHYFEAYKNVEKCLYVSADNIHVASTGLFAIAQEYFKYGGEAIIIDEVHKYPQWPTEVKNIVDTYREKKLLLSGSSAIALTKGIADLSRRIVSYDLGGLSFREYLSFVKGSPFPAFSLEDIFKRHVAIAGKISEQLTSDDPVLKHFRNYLRHGYYPFFIEGIDDYFPKLENVIAKVLGEDIPAAFNITPAKIIPLKKMLWLIATSQPFLPNIERMSQSLNLSKESTYGFLEYLERAGLVRFIFPQGRGHKLVRKPGKVLLSNTNLLETITGSLNLASDTGGVRESFFASQLQGHKLKMGDSADFLVDDRYTVEVGGASKNLGQIKGKEEAYLALDNIEIGAGKRIPLYLFGFLY